MINLFDVGFYGVLIGEKDSDLVFEATAGLDTEVIDTYDFEEGFFKEVALELLNKEYMYALDPYDIDYIAFRSRVDETYYGFEIEWNSDKKKYEVL